MRKALLFAPMLMLLLTACGGGEEKDPAVALQEQYAAVASATMEADVTCHYTDEVRTYTLLCAYTPDESTVTVLAPSSLSGISATVAEGALQLSYEDISLDAGGYSAAAISPVAALPRLMEAAASGDLPGEEGTVYTTWFDRQTMLPLRSEITSDSVLVFEVAWSRFEVGQAGEAPAEPEQTAPPEPEKDWTEADEAAAYAGAEE